MYGICPENGDIDEYTLKLTFDRFVLVESVVEVVSRYENQRIYQEDLTEAISKSLDCLAETWCNHRGVKTYARYDATLPRNADNS